MVPLVRDYMLRLRTNENLPNRTTYYSISKEILLDPTDNGFIRGTRLYVSKFG